MSPGELYRLIDWQIFGLLDRLVVSYSYYRCFLEDYEDGKGDIKMLLFVVVDLLILVPQLKETFFEP